jgi:hypothetical protein
VVGHLLSLLANLWPIWWRLIARRRGSLSSVLGDGGCSGGVPLRDGATASVVGVWRPCAR